MSISTKPLNHPQVVEPIPAPTYNDSRPAKGARPDGNAGSPSPVTANDEPRLTIHERAEG